MHDTETLISLVIPTRNEQENILPLLERISIALAGRLFEVVFVDDSDDDTSANVLTACVIRAIPITDSDVNRSLIPFHTDH